MERKAFKMRIKPGCEAEYKRRHDEIWPELSELLRESGVCDYTIFLDAETRTLFAVQKLKEGNKAGSLAETRIMRAWWDYMADIMEVNTDNSPKVVLLAEVFHLD